MDTMSENHAYDYTTVMANYAKIAEKSQQVVEKFMKKNLLQPEEPDPLHIGDAFVTMFAQMLSDPEKLVKQQMQWWSDYMQLLDSYGRKFWEIDDGANKNKESAGGDSSENNSTTDRRFRDKAWNDNILFNFLKQSYLLTAKYMLDNVNSTKGIDEHTKHKLKFFTKQYVDAISPSNFIITNPEVLRATLESGGENLLHGLENLLHDLENSKSHLRISMADESAFEVGVNIAATAGKVIYQNDLMQLIQYSPQTDKVYKTPLLMIPAWINKYYILDLQPQNSLVKWMVERGYTVFMISWVNPNEKHADKTFDDYMLEGPLAALDAIEKATGEKTISVIGYCLGGTLLAITLSWLHARGEADRVKNATYLTTMIDFKHAGDLEVFVDEEQLEALEKRMQQTGYLSGEEMANTFSMLRANDLIWSFVVNNYLLGRSPFPFDLLYWNSDTTRMPARMHSFYLRKMYLENRLVKPGGVTIAGEKIDLYKIKTPGYILSTHDDHIAPWRATYAATNIYGGKLRFVLGASGHVAGVINPPAKNKYSYLVQDRRTSDYPRSPDEWLREAKEHSGSWWVDWDKWLGKQSGGKVPARIAGGGKLKAIEDAPGSYVKERS